MHVRLSRLFVTVLLILFPASLLAAGPQRVSYTTSTGQTVHGLLYEPAGHGKHPAIVVIHEWWGLDTWIEQQAQQLAHEGYVALAVDLYGGKVTTNPQVARQLDMALKPEEATANVVGAAHYLAAQKNVDAHRIGAVGWCMGGGYAALLAVHDPTLKAVAINYGELPQSRAELAKIQAPVLGIFGGADPVVTPAEVAAFEQTMRSLGKSITVKTYPGAGHAFENPNNRMGYRPADAADAQARMRAFFARELKASTKVASQPGQ
jgi:carboxymethylenebutenolidase